MTEKKGLSYKDAGVDVDAGNQAVEEIKGIVKRTFRPEVLTELGGFGGAFAFDAAKYESPVLVSGTDGVGTKLKVAFMADKHDTVGIDLVAMCVNDILAQGAEPLFFLDYIATGKLFPHQIRDLVSGIAEGCIQSGCALIGGETAEMPGFYQAGEYDTAGFVVGVVDRERMLPKATIAPGHAVIGVASSGVHSNGFSLVRKVIFEVAGLKPDDYVEALGKTVSEELLTPTRIYIKDVLPVIQKGWIDGVSHITGGGFTENIPRMLPEGMGCQIDLGSWPVLPVFDYLAETAQIEQAEMYRTFNMGIGLALAVPQEHVEAVMAQLNADGEQAYVIGRVTDSEGMVYNG